MKASLCLEYIGEGFAHTEAILSMKMFLASGGRDRGVEISKCRKPWVAEITGTDDKFGFQRQFLRGNVQRKRSSSTGNRGSELWFTIESNHIYQVQYFASWRDKRRYFVTVTDDGEIVKVEEKWVRNRLELMSSPPQGNA